MGKLFRNLVITGALISLFAFGVVRYREHAIERDYKARMARELAAQQEAGRREVQKRMAETAKELREHEAQLSSLEAEADRMLEAIEARKRAKK